MISITLEGDEFLAALRGYVGRVGTEHVRLTETFSKHLRFQIARRSPVDTTRLARSWTARTVKIPGGTYSRAAKVATRVPYAPVLEYGLYPGVGRRTVSVGSRDLGEGFVAATGIYSRQAPWGFVRQTMVKEFPGFVRQLRENVRNNWGKR